MNIKDIPLLRAACLAAAIAAPTPAAAETVSIVAFGDSLTAGYGLGPGEAFPEQLERALKARGHDVTVLNAGVSGDTASAGLARLEWSVPAEADAVIVEPGANDMLRGIDPNVTRKALQTIVGKLKERDQKVLLAGMQAPLNLGPQYAASFNRIFPDLAADEKVMLYPFFLDGVAADRTLNLQDGVHPTAKGIARIVEAILPSVERLIAEVKAGG